MPVLIVVPCGMRKIWDSRPDAGPTKAEDAYIGLPFKTNKAYAERFGDRWVILSAKYGFIDPEFVIPENYDVTFKRPQTNPVTVEKLRMQIREKGLDRFDKVVVLGGRDYTETAKRAFQNFKVRITAPTLGLRLGEAMEKVRKAIEDNTPFDC
jgi:hypothetical protein